MSTSLKVILVVSFLLLLISLPWLLGYAPGGAILAWVDVIWFGGVITLLFRGKKKLL